MPWEAWVMLAMTLFNILGGVGQNIKAAAELYKERIYPEGDTSAIDTLMVRAGIGVVLGGLWVFMILRLAEVI